MAQATATDAGKPPEPEKSLEALGEEGNRLAAGMRPLKSAELSGAREVGQELVANLDADACLRVVFSSAEAVVAKLADDKGRTLAELPAVLDGKLGERGPICVRRGTTVHVQFSAPGDIVVRFASWTSR